MIGFSTHWDNNDFFVLSESGFACGCSTRLERGVCENCDFRVRVTHPHAKIGISTCRHLSRPQGKITNRNKKNQNARTASRRLPRLRQPSRQSREIRLRCGSDGSSISLLSGRRIHSAATTIAVVASAALAEAAAAVTRRWKKWEEEADREREEWEEEADREGGVGVGAKREMGGESGCGAI